MDGATWSPSKTGEDSRNTRNVYPDGLQPINNPSFYEGVYGLHYQTPEYIYTVARLIIILRKVPTTDRGVERRMENLGVYGHLDDARARVTLEREVTLAEFSNSPDNDEDSSSSSSPSSSSSSSSSSSDDDAEENAGAGNGVATTTEEARDDGDKEDDGDEWLGFKIDRPDAWSYHTKSEDDLVSIDCWIEKGLVLQHLPKFP